MYKQTHTIVICLLTVFATTFHTSIHCKKITKELNSSSESKRLQNRWTKKSHKKKSLSKTSTKKKTGNPFPNKKLKDLNEQELAQLLDFAIGSKNRELVFKVFHQLLALAAHQTQIKEYKLKLAEYCYEVGELEKASFTYEDFAKLYPSSQEAEYAQYKAVLCYFYSSLAPDLDQTNTHKALSVAQDFLKKATNELHISETKDIIAKCRQKLLEHEVHIFASYLTQKKYSSAEQRFNYICKNFDDINDIKAYISYLQKILDHAKKHQNNFFPPEVSLENALKKDTKITKKKLNAFFLS